MRRPSDTGDGSRSAVQTRAAAITPLLAAGLLSIVWLRRPIGLIEPTGCPGLFEYVLPLVLRAFEDLRVGGLLAWINGAAAFAALATFIRLAHTVSGSLPGAVAAAAAMVATTAFDRGLAPPSHLAVLGVSCGVGLTLHRLSQAERGRASAAWQLLSAALMLALLTPRHFITALVLMGVATGWADTSLVRSRRWIAAAAAGVAVMLFAMFSARTFAQTGVVRMAAVSCIAPVWSGGTTIREGLTSALAVVGPFPIALAALGVFAAAAGRRHALPFWTVGLATLPVTLGAWRAADAAIATSVAAFWCVVAAGLGEMVAEGRRSPARLMAATVLLVLLPMLAFQRLRERDPSMAPAAGHEHLSSGVVLRALRGLPPVTLVSEDAATDLVLRSVSSPLARGGRTVRVIGRDAGDVAAALARAPVLAFPRAQQFLQHRGIEFRGGTGDAVGLARVESVHRCSAVGSGWAEAPAVALTNRFALVATEREARGPLTLYLGSDSPLTASPVDWRERDRRGFHPRPYGAARSDLHQALLSQGLPPSSRLLTAPHVLRLVLWRTPGAPGVLAIELSGRPTVAVVRSDAARQEGIELCPSYQFEARSVAAR